MNYDEAKDEVMRHLHPAQVQAGRVAQLANRETAGAGMVHWEASPPVNTDWCEHKQSFADAIYTALGFCLGDTRKEWVVLGRVGVTTIRSVSKFNEVEGAICWPTRLVYIGQLGIIAVYFDPQLPTCEFLAGVLEGKYPDVRLCCRGIIINPPARFLEGEPEPMEPGTPMWRALQGAVNNVTDEVDDNGDEITYDPATMQPVVARQRA